MQSNMPVEYFFNGHPRWTFLWDNPNCWAVFLACLLPWIWWLEDAWRRHSPAQIPGLSGTIALRFAELAIWFLLAKTYSRGGFVAAACAMLFFFLSRRDASSRARQCARIAARLLALAILCFAVGASGRLSPGFVAQDKSVLNRMDLWSGALSMMRDSPFHGWGDRFGGIAYINWYQPQGATERPIGFVNSYLDIAVEKGTPFLCVILVVLFMAFMAAAKQRNKPRVIASGACLLAWCAGNFWSSLWAVPLLWILPVACLLCIFVEGFRARLPAKRVFAISTSAALLVVFAALGAGEILHRDRALRAVPQSHSDVVEVTMREFEGDKQNLPTIELYADPEILGSFYGKMFRPLINELPPARFMFHFRRQQQRTGDGDSAHARVYCGFQAARLVSGGRHEGATVILFPTVFPPATADGMIDFSKVIVCLPQADTSAYDLPWRLWGKRNGARVVYAPQGGRKITGFEDFSFWKTLLFYEKGQAL